MSTWLISSLVIYLVGVLLCVYIMVRNNRKHKVKFSLIEVFLTVYLAILSWVGVLSLLAGAMTHFNMIEWDEENGEKV